MIGEGEERGLINGIAVVEIGDRVVTPAELSEDGETITTPAVMKGTHAVDILWQTVEPIEAITAYVVYPNPCGIHTFAGLDHLYENEYYTKFPELKPETNI
jgi:hypothetical protein